MQQYLEVGKVVAVHGVMGEVRVQPWADSPDFLCQFKTLYVDQNHWPIQVERARVHKNMVIFKFEGVTDVPSGMALRNAILYIDRADADLMGLEVRSAATGDVIGTLADVRDLPAHKIYIVKTPEREMMIPAVPQFIAETNIEGGYIRVNLMEGL